VYFSDERAVEEAMREASPARRAQLALVGFGYWHYGLLLGVVAVAAGLEEAIAGPYDPLHGWIGVELAVGTALFLACDVGFRRTLGIPRGGARLAAAAVALATIPLGTELAASAQLAALVALVVAALALEARTGLPDDTRPLGESIRRKGVPP
jgi:low temperature requirement protein LtrA